jgi:hypothetical protein
MGRKRDDENDRWGNDGEIERQIDREARRQRNGEQKK